MSNYKALVEGKTAEQILATDQAWAANGTVSSCLRIAAQVRSNEELISELKRASADSGKVSRQLVALTRALAALTGVLALVGIAQVIATAWPYLVYWWHR
jgi:hypothetical protein